MSDKVQSDSYEAPSVEEIDSGGLPIGTDAGLSGPQT